MLRTVYKDTKKIRKRKNRIPLLATLRYSLLRPAGPAYSVVREKNASLIVLAG